MEFIKVTINMPKIDGYEYTGMFRVPVEGDYVANNKYTDCIKVDFNDTYIAQPIFEKQITGEERKND